MTIHIYLKRTIRLLSGAVLGILLVAGVACGGGQGAEPTPTSTAMPTATVEATPTAAVSGCPLPSDGKGNIAGLLVWKGKPWVNEFDTITILKLYSSDALIKDDEDTVHVEGNTTATITSNYDGSFCFHDIEPGEYCIMCWCPPGFNRSGALSQYIRVTEGKTYWLGFDPYYGCTSPRD